MTPGGSYIRQEGIEYRKEIDVKLDTEMVYTEFEYCSLSSVGQ